MALDFILFDAFLEAEAEKKHNFQSDQFMVALTAAANPPLITDAVLTDLTEISYAGCSSRIVTTTSSGQISGVYRFIASGLMLTASGGGFGPFRYIALYNNSAANKELVGYMDYGSELTFTAGSSFFIGFNTSLGIFSKTQQ